MTTPERIGAQIREWRRRRGLTQEALGEKIGSDGTWVGRLEKGSENPTVATLDKVAAALEIDVSQLLAPRPEETGHEREVGGGSGGGAGLEADNFTIEDARSKILALIDRDDPAADSVEGDVLKAHAILTRAVQRIGRAAAQRAVGDNEQ